jgi:hypothetical protein
MQTIGHVGDVELWSKGPTSMRGNGLITTAATLALLVMASTAVAALSFFDVVSDLETVTGPPYPTACHRTDVAHETSGMFERDGRLALGIRGVVDGAGTPLGTNLAPLEDHVPGCDFMEDSHFDVTYCAGSDGAAFPTESAIGLLIELTSLDGRPGKLIALHPELPVVDPERFFDVFSGDSSVEFVCHVEFDRGVVHEISLRADTSEGLHLADAAVVILEQNLENELRADPANVGSYFSAHPDGFFDVRLRLERDADFDDSLPLLSLTFSGHFLGGTSPVETTTWGAIKTLFR